jgi:hypothetical protein
MIFDHSKRPSSSVTPPQSQEWEIRPMMWTAPQEAEPEVQPQPENPQSQTRPTAEDLLTRLAEAADPGKGSQTGGEQQFLDTELLARADPAKSVGRAVQTEFGDYWIVPDKTPLTASAKGEPITESEFSRLEKTWNALKSGSGKIQILEYSDFKARILAQFGKLLSKPIGRQLVTELVNGSQTVTIVPTTLRAYSMLAAPKDLDEAYEDANGKPGKGSSTTILIDVALTDTDVLVFDDKGKKIALPLHITLGHELIHAQHFAAGRGKNYLPAKDLKNYPDREEEETIATGKLTENDLRREHKLPLRYGHKGEIQFPQNPPQRKPPQKK